MSTVNMGPAEGPAPVNFSQGGAVQYMDNGGPVRYMEKAGAVTSDDQFLKNIDPFEGRQKELYQQERDFYRSTLLDPERNQADLNKQKNLTQAQMLFDVAQGALAFASPGDRQMSPAERLAQSFSPVLGSIGARAGEFGKFKQAQDAEEKQYDLAAMQSSQRLYAAERASAAAAAAAAAENANKDIGKLYDVTIPSGTEGGESTIQRLPLTRGDIEAYDDEYGSGVVGIKLVPEEVKLGAVINFTLKTGGVVAAHTNSQRAMDIIRAGGALTGELSGKPGSAENFTMLDGTLKAAVPGTSDYDKILLAGGIASTDLSAGGTASTVVMPNNAIVSAVPGTNKYSKAIAGGGIDTEFAARMDNTGKTENFIVNGEMKSAIVGTEKHDNIIAGDFVSMGVAPTSTVTNKKSYVTNQPVDMGGKHYPSGSTLMLNELELNQAHNDYGKDVFSSKASDPKSAEFITFVNPNDRNDFLTFNKNDTSAANMANMNIAANAIDQVSGARIYRIGGNLSAASGGSEISSSDILNLVKKDQNGGIVDVKLINLGSPTAATELINLQNLGYVKGATQSLDGAKATPNMKVFIDVNNPADRRDIDINSPEGYAEMLALQASDKKWSMTTVPTMADLAMGINLGNGEDANLMALLSTQSTMDAYADNTLDPSTANLINSYLTNRMRLTPVFDETQSKWILTPGLKVTTAVLDAIDNRGLIEGASMPTVGARGLDLNPDAQDKTTGRIKFKSDGSIDFTTFEEDDVVLITDIDLTQSQGLGSSWNRFKNAVAGQLTDIGWSSGSGYGGTTAAITSIADKQLSVLSKKIMSTARSGINGKVFSYDITLLAETVDGFLPGGLKTDNGARDQLVAVRRDLASMYIGATYTINNPTDQSNTGVIGQAKVLQKDLESLIAETTAAIAIYDKFITTDPLESAQTDQQLLMKKGKPTTSLLQRASSVTPEEN